MSWKILLIIVSHWQSMAVICIKQWPAGGKAKSRCRWVMLKVKKLKTD
jgi:hypothetical protein